MGDAGGASVLEIRTFTEKDRTELRALFGRAGEGAPTASLWGHEESEAAIYRTPYLDLEPDSLFVAVVDGALAGYLSGCLDSSTFPSESERFDQAIKQYRLMSAMLRAKNAMALRRNIMVQHRWFPASGTKASDSTADDGLAPVACLVPVSGDRRPW